MVLGHFPDSYFPNDYFPNLKKQLFPESNFPQWKNPNYFFSEMKKSQIPFSRTVYTIFPVSFPEFFFEIQKNSIHAFRKSDNKSSK